MSHLILQLVIIGLGAAVSPVALTALIVIMTKNHARRNSLLFLLGFTLSLLAIGFLGVSVFHLSNFGHSKIDGYIDLSLAFVCFGFAIYSCIKSGERKTKGISDNIKPLGAVLLGSVFMLANTTTIIIYIPGLHVIGAAKLPIEESVLMLIILTLVTLSSLFVPILMFFLFPKRSEEALGVLKNWLNRNKKKIGIFVLFIIGSYLFIKGIRSLL